MRFVDVPAHHPHRVGIEWAVNRGIVQGYADQTFRPEQPLTRGQMATILHRLFREVMVEVTGVSPYGQATSTATVDTYVTVTYPDDGSDPIVTEEPA